ncbi:MAG: TonB-dependent receptor domain-containing protein, partial [Wenzhouxiangellaceae bacterium]
EAHLLEFDAEVALNTLDSELRLQVNDGDGPVPVPVPGANSRVEERRADVSIADSWQLDPWLLETALAAEASRISQSGPSGESREFFFLKPRLALTWAPTRNRQTRLSVERRVAQLNFGDFVSAVNFEDDDFDLGNPMLSPSSTWAVELTGEQRFGEIGVVSVTAFGNWITDVQDLLPVSDRFEVPGNIGDGRRWGVTLEATLPLEALGVRGGRLDLESEWQRSRVTDPVTGLNRSLSGERDYDVELEFRQDLARPSLSWGFELERGADRRDFGIDEIDRFEQGLEFEAFIETSQWFGVKFSLTAQNLLNRQFIRERLFFDGPRDSAGLLFRENRDRRRERSLVFGVSGSF